MYGPKIINRKTGLSYYETIDGILNKRCNKCNKIKPLTSEYYHRGNNNKYGYKSECKECRGNPKKVITNPDKQGNIPCRVCKESKSKEEFYLCNGKYVRECKNCQSARKQKYRRTRNQRTDIDSHIKALISGCITRTKGLTKKGSAKNRECTITIEDIKKLYKEQQGKCKISGIQMTAIIGHGKQVYNISIDRKDNTKGYIPDNIQLVCAHINIMKGAISEYELINICNQITIYNGNQDKKS